RGRGAAVVLASGFAISLTTLSGGMVPALADPPRQPAPPVTTTAPTATTTQPPVTTTDGLPVPAVTLTLAPEQGGPGTPVKATTPGFGVCLDNLQSMSLWWDAHQVLPASNVRSVNAGTGSVAADFMVPDNASTGRHTVTARCYPPPDSSRVAV